jgi:rhodanese-related sulfurtransferase
MSRSFLVAALLLSAPAVFAQAPATPATAAAKPSQPAFCSNCHKLAPDQVAGYFDAVAFKTTAIQLDIGAGPQIVRFDPKTLKVIDAGVEKNVEHLRDVKKRHEARITYVEKDGVKFATEIRFKGPIKIAADKLIDYAGVAKLVAGGQAPAPYTLIDSRPPPRFQEGAIPTAVNLPFIGFDKFADRLPKDKAQLVVFYCGGLTCTLSPNSLRKAETMGYTNVRVYREGMPEWQARNYGVLTPQFLKAAFIDKDIPHVLIDARSADDAASGHIKGAVSVPAQQLKAMLKTLPDPKLKAPIIVYDARGREQSVAAAKAFVAAGQQNVVVVDGGLIGWQAAGYSIVDGAPASTKIAYVPMPRPGSIPADEFTKLARNTPADVLILDVRNSDEANAGMIKGAMLVPDEELAARMAEVPKDKRIVTHCITGIRAEMAYHKLKEAGYNVSFLNADIDVAKNGSFKITPH